MQTSRFCSWIYFRNLLIQYWKYDCETVCKQIWTNQMYWHATLNEVCSWIYWRELLAEISSCKLATLYSSIESKKLFVVRKWTAIGTRVEENRKLLTIQLIQIWEYKKYWKLRSESIKEILNMQNCIWNEHTTLINLAYQIFQLLL